ncbi:MAG: GlsB/YeaQ/YmgE family stress response membrane protein [Planctomycetaceae bacterium]
MILGLVGSMVGGFVSSLIFGYDPMDPGFHTSGLIMSTLGAIAVLAIYGSISRRK